MTPSQKDFSKREVLSVHAPISPTGFEYYLMVRIHSESTTEVTGYEKFLLALDPSLQSDAGTTKVDALENHQLIVIANLLKERNARTVGDGQWIVSGLRTVLGSEDFRLMISFRRYCNDFVDSQRIDFARDAVQNTSGDPAEVSEENAITATEEAAEEISRIMIQQPDSFDSVIDSTVGSRSPTPDSELDSRASTPVSSDIRTEKEIQIDELDSLEESACKLSKSINGSVTALSILKGVLQARKILMGEEHFQSFKTMGNLGYWYVRYGWTREGTSLLQKAVGGLRNVLGERNEHTLATMYKLAQVEYLQSNYRNAWFLFHKVLEGRIDVLGKNHEATLDAIKGLEEIYRQQGRRYKSAEKLPLLMSLAKYEIEVRGEDHEHTLEVMDLVVETLVELERHSSQANSTAEAYLESAVKRRMPVLADEKVALYGQYVLGKLNASSIMPFPHTWYER
ncbi:hypothetical protein RUND412_007659 [Rhizina undulata]